MVDPSSLLSTLAEHDPRLCFAFDISNKRFIYANPAFEAFFQMKHSQTSAASLLAMVHPQDLEYLKEGFASLKPGIFKNNVEFRMQLPGRKECFLRLSLIYTDQHLQSEEHTLTGYLEDYTADKEHEDTLNEYSNKKMLS